MHGVDLDGRFYTVLLDGLAQVREGGRERGREGGLAVFDR